jgi:hypothetical protein
MAPRADAVNLDLSSSRRRLAWALFIALTCFYLLGSGGTIDTPDGVLMFRVTQSLVERRSTSVPMLPGASDWGGMAVEDAATHEPRFYAKYGLGLPLAAVPAYLGGLILEPLATRREREIFPAADHRRKLWYDTSPENFREAFLAFAATWTSAALVAGALTGVLLLALELGYGARAALMAALLGALASPLWAYSKTFFSEPLAGAGLVFCFYFAVRGRKGSGGAWNWILSGLCLGVCVLAKAVNVLLVIPALALTVAPMRETSFRERFRRCALLAPGLLAAIFLILAYNYARFGSWWETGYSDEVWSWTTPWGEGILGLLISPGRGLLLYFPLWILVVPGIARMLTSHRAETFFLGGCFGLVWLVHARWYRWEGGWCWGPRFLIPVIPLLILPLASLFERPPRQRAFKIVALLVVGIALLISFSGVWVDFNDYHHWLYERFENEKGLFQARGFSSSTDVYRWSWADSPLLGYWAFPVKDDLLLLRAIRRPGVILTLFLLEIGVGSGQACRIVRCARSSALPR